MRSTSIIQRSPHPETCRLRRGGGKTVWHEKPSARLIGPSESEGKWPIVDGVMLIPDPLNPAASESFVTDAAWARALPIRCRSKTSVKSVAILPPTGCSPYPRPNGRKAGRPPRRTSKSLPAFVTTRPRFCDVSQLASTTTPTPETNHGEVSQRNCVSFERDDGNPAPVVDPSVLDARRCLTVDVPPGYVDRSWCSIVQATLAAPPAQSCWPRPSASESPGCVG